MKRVYVCHASHLREAANQCTQTGEAIENIHRRLHQSLMNMQLEARRKLELERLSHEAVRQIEALQHRYRDLAKYLHDTAARFEKADAAGILVWAQTLKDVGVGVGAAFPFVKAGLAGTLLKTNSMEIVKAENGLHRVQSAAWVQKGKMESFLTKNVLSLGKQLEFVGSIPKQMVKAGAPGAVVINTASEIPKIKDSFSANLAKEQDYTVTLSNISEGIMSSLFTHTSYKAGTRCARIRRPNHIHTK
ncbi:hypothetical protein [Ectobacillus panaciterrae]|uniref:hypothetical protein n=1 Tax=Ectobacillus panaciterrae TaxID=363872 RepID=UPI00048E5542|nr:hypothetical protein [Ectobacillus panaciterrae]